MQIPTLGRKRTASQRLRLAPLSPRKPATVLCDLIKEHKIDEHDFEQLCYDMDDCISSLEKDDVLYTETEFDYDKEITHQQWLPH